MADTFAATVEGWVKNVQGAFEEIWKEAAQELVIQMQDLLQQYVYDGPVSESGYRRTGFLLASLVASKDAMPRLHRENPGVAASFDPGPVMLVINDAEIGETIYLGYTANYGAFVHFGARGNAGRPWVDMVAQRWPLLVHAAVAEVKKRRGL